jgi:peptidoglycan hydrolase-like protein with peptidoglycan-binding domain
LTPGSSQDVSISLAEGLNFGEYSTVLYAGVNGQGDEPMIIDIRKLCHEPEWELNPSEFQYSMNITGMLRTRPSPAVLDSSSDVYDMVGVFVGEELRGVGTIEYLPDLETISNFHPYEVFLTVYSNVSEGDDLSFRVWDASGCAILGQIEEEILFSANAVIGSLTNPTNLTATSEVLSDHAYPEGWTWLSMNTYQADMSINTILSTFSPLSGDLIKSQTEFAQYSTESNMWVGGLDTLDHRSTYLLKLGEEDTLTRIGYPIDVELDTITINEGWNWVGYTPQESYLINDALASLDTVVITGNIVKSQTGYAQFLENYGWYGSMNYMDPGEGYLINTASDGVLLYPFNIPQNMLEGTDEPPVRELADNAPEWDVNPSQYSGTMNITGELIVLDEISANPLDMVGAFINDECRGVGQPIYIEPLGKYIVFLTIYGDENETSNLQFHAYSEASDEILYAPETIPFELDNIIGNLEEPYIWDTRYLEAGDTGFMPNVFSLSQNYPNPFNPSTTISFGVPRVSQVNITIYDILGKKVTTLVNEKMEPGYYFKTWDSRNKYGNEVAAGIYFYQIHAEGFTKTRKLILLK